MVSTWPPKLWFSPPVLQESWVLRLWIPRKVTNWYNWLLFLLKIIIIPVSYPSDPYRFDYFFLATDSPYPPVRRVETNVRNVFPGFYQPRLDQKIVFLLVSIYFICFLNLWLACFGAVKASWPDLSPFHFCYSIIRFSWAAMDKSMLKKSCLYVCRRSSGTFIICSEAKTQIRRETISGKLSQKNNFMCL